MDHAARPVYNDDVLPAVRELLSRCPAVADSEPETLARMLYVLRFLPYRPEGHEVEEALEALYLEDGIAA